MQLLLAVATSPVFPGPGQHVTYAIHDTMPRGGSDDETITLTGERAQGVSVSIPGKPPVHVALEGGRPARMDRQIGKGVHWLTLADEIVEAALAGRHSVNVEIGPPGSPPVTLAVTSAGGTITAIGTAEMPPPPPGDGHAPPPPQGGHNMHIRIVATVVRGQLASAKGTMTPQGGQGPGASWSVNRKK